MSPTWDPAAIRIRTTRDVAYSRMTRVPLQSPDLGLILRNSIYGAPFLSGNSRGGTPAVSRKCRDSIGHSTWSSSCPAASILEDIIEGAENASNVAALSVRAVVFSRASTTRLVKYVAPPTWSRKPGAAYIRRSFAVAPERHNSDGISIWSVYVLSPTTFGAFPSPTFPQNRAIQCVRNFSLSGALHVARRILA